MSENIELNSNDLVGKKIGRHDLKHGTDEYEDRNYIRGVKKEDGKLKIYTGYDPETNPDWGTFWEIVIHLDN